MPVAIRAQSAPVTDRLSAAVIHLSKWTAFLSGVALLVAVALIPPASDLDTIQRQRDRILAMEQTDLARIANYQALIHAIDERDPDTIRLLMASELQLVPKGRTALVVPGQPADSRLFERLEPMPTPMPAEAAAPVSTLARLAGDRRGRLILLTIGGLALLWGLMPPLAEPD